MCTNTLTRGNHCSPPSCLLASTGHASTLARDIGRTHQFNLPVSNLYWRKITLLHVSLCVCIVQTWLKQFFPNAFHVISLSILTLWVKVWLFIPVGSPGRFQTLLVQARYILIINYSLKYGLQAKIMQMLLGSQAFRNTHYAVEKEPSWIYYKCVQCSFKIVVPWPTCCNFSQALLCCGKEGGTQMSISLCRRLGVSRQLCPPLGCSLTSLTPCLRLARGKSPSLAFLSFSLPHLHKPTEELHPCILTLLNATINSALVSAKLSYLHRSFQPNFCANPILIQPEYWQQPLPFPGLQECCPKSICYFRNKKWLNVKMLISKGMTALGKQLVFFPWLHSLKICLHWILIHEHQGFCTKSLVKKQLISWSLSLFTAQIPRQTRTCPRLLTKSLYHNSLATKARRRNANLFKTKSALLT